MLSGQMSGVYIKSHGKVLKKVLEIIRSGAMGPHLKGLEVNLNGVETCCLLYRVMEEKACIHLEELVVWLGSTSDDNIVGGNIMSLLAQGKSV